MITVQGKYNNAVIGDMIDARKDRLQTDAESDLLKSQALLAIANKPAGETSKLLIILPIAVVLIGGIVAVVLIKKKRGK